VLFVLSLTFATRPNASQYPVENAYSQYLSSHSGYSNAYTAATETNYFFEVAASSESDTASPKDSPLYGALDRFAQFFVAPLFLADTLDRELKAVDSENKKNLQSDNWRLSQLNKSLSNPKHPFHHFSTGNLETLRDGPRQRGVEIREKFMEFHDKHYSANRMKLVVLGKEPLETLESWVTELFADVQNKDLPENRWDGAAPYSKNELLMQVFAKPVMESRSLDIQFTYQDEEELYKTQPSRYLSHLIGHEGPGSILAYIKAKGWATGLSAGPAPVCPGTSFFNISIRLTPEGLKVYQEVVKTVFYYISLLKETPPQKWIVEECKELADVDFRFMEKSGASRFTSRLSSVMQKPLPREWLLSGPLLIRDFNSADISKALSYLTAENYRLTIVSQDFPGNWDKREKWYGTEYCQEKLSTEFTNSVREALESSPAQRPSALHLPNKNEFIPTRFSVEKKEVSEPAKTPKLIRNDIGIRTWWKKDDQFWVPRGNIIVVLRTPLASVTPSNTVKTKFFCELVQDSLNEYAYDAEIAGLSYNLNGHTLGLDVEISGYNDKMAVLLEKVLLGMKNLEVKNDRFDIVKERLRRGYSNWDFQQPYRQVADFTRWLTSERSWINPEHAVELPHIQADDIRAFFPQLLQQLHVEVLAHGNLYKEDALRITDMIESTLKSRPLPQAQWQVRRNLIIPPGSDFTYQRTLEDPANINNCIEYYLYCGDSADQALRAKILLFGQLTEEPGFDQLRTKEQLGYIVFTGARAGATTIGYRVLIQSERTTQYLEDRINAFLANFGKTLQDMSQKDFDGYKRSLINRRLEKLKNLDQESTRLWTHISSEYYRFMQVESDVEHIRALSKDDVIAFFNHYISPTSEHRAKVAIHLQAKSNAFIATVKIAPKDQKAKVLAMLGKYLNSQGVQADAEKLAQVFQDIDIAGGDQDGTVAAITKHLEEDLNIDAEKAKAVTDEGKKLLATILPGVGIEVKEKASADFPEAPNVKETVYIENVQQYKASLETTAGPRPVVDISEFEEMEAKL
jgi:insulysin